ncbi:phosphoglyceromutase [Nitzschia inconspicua]|uniref:Phosphoglyceromutase n=1 Tax=Nitzschia inconspicua TaxID=303405 RepID=A0A9K3Q0L2_9STRA|nr:phosphoglyceromutase [Nitzschia inconspicua]
METWKPQEQFKSPLSIPKTRSEAPQGLGGIFILIGDEDSCDREDDEIDQGVPVPGPGSSSENSSAMIDATILAGPNLPPIKAAAKRLFLVRHGEVINPGGDRAVYYGAMEVPLSPLGEAEATAAATYLKIREEEIDLVVSSPLSRAIFGANEVLKQQSALSQSDILVLDGFTELDRGAWCGKTKDEIGDDLMARFDACDESVTPEGGESYPFLKNRVLQARDVVLDKLAPGRAAVIVSHLQVTRSMLSEALGIPIEQMSGLKVATASVTCIDYDSSAGTQTVHFQSFKPKVGLQTSRDGAN